MFFGLLRGLMRMGKFSKRQSRGTLTPKTLPSSWIKGRGVRAIGRHTKKGGYVRMWSKIPIYVVPDLTGCKLKPYVSRLTRPPPALKPSSTPVASE